MNIALPALVILLGLLPGIVFFYTYYSGRFDKRQAGVSAAEELGLYIFFAVPLNALAFVISRWIGVDLNFALTARLLAGDLTDANVAELASVFSSNATLTAVTYFLILLGSAALGSFARRVVWASRLDTSVPYLRMKHDWFYVLHGRQRHLPRSVVTYVDVLTKHPQEGSRLYNGVVLHFEVGTGGSLESITLIYPRRGKDRGENFHWKDIPSDRLTIRGSEIHSLNIGYVSIEPEENERTSRVRRWWLSFWYEQP